MDNDNKVSALPSGSDVHKEVALLLENELGRIARNDKKEFFNIESEFEKTRRNNLSFMWENMFRRLLICLGVVFVITLILLIFVSNSNKKISVDVNEFETLNLSSLLSKVNDIDTKIQEAERAKKELVEKRNAEIERIEGTRSAALKSLAAMNIKNKRTRLQHEEKIEQEYRAELASVEKYTKLIENCNDDIKMYTEQRNEFDAGRVREAEKQKAIINSERFLHEKEKEELINSYEARLEEDRNELKRVQAEDLKNLEESVTRAVNQYDPPLPRDADVKKLVSGAKDLPDSYSGAVYEGIAIPVSESASEEFRNSLEETQKKFYSSIDRLYELLSQMSHKEGNAVSSFVRAMKRYAFAAGNELSVLSAAEVNRLIAEKAAVEEAREKAESSYISFLEAMCGESIGKNSVDGIVTSVQPDGSADIYISSGSRDVFNNPEYSGLPFSCTVYRGKDKAAVANIELRDGLYVLSNVSFDARLGKTLKTGDRISISGPVHP
ncbi:MAG: hypothetical protein J6K96_00790 [Treponema sp.]|nr:hypothetical protein [Treponema sp.]